MSTFFDDLFKAQRTKPAGHKAYTRKTKTGKLVQVKQKGAVSPPVLPSVRLPYEHSASDRAAAHKKLHAKLQEKGFRRIGTHSAKPSHGGHAIHTYHHPASDSYAVVEHDNDEGAGEVRAGGGDANDIRSIFSFHSQRAVPSHQLDPKAHELKEAHAHASKRGKGGLSWAHSKEGSSARTSHGAYTVRAVHKTRGVTPMHGITYTPKRGEKQQHLVTGSREKALALAHKHHQAMTTKKSVQPEGLEKSSGTKPFHSTPKGDYFHSRDALGRMGAVHFKPKGGTRMKRVGLTEGAGSHHSQAMSLARRHSAGSTKKSEGSPVSTFFDDLFKAQRKKPYGHKAYTRKTKTGKLVQVKQKGPAKALAASSLRWSLREHPHAKTPDQSGPYPTSYSRPRGREPMHTRTAKTDHGTYVIHPSSRGGYNAVYVPKGGKVPHLDELYASTWTGRRYPPGVRLLDDAYKVSDLKEVVAEHHRGGGGDAPVTPTWHKYSPPLPWLKPTKPKESSKSMQSNPHTEESFMSFEEIFKSEESNMSDFEKAASPFSSLAHKHGASMRTASSAGFHSPKKAKAFAVAARAAGHAVRHGRSSSMGGMHTVHLKKSNPHTEESFMSFEEILKSEADHCESCGQAINKAMKHKKKGKRGVAQMIGNEMDPHKGKPSGSVFVGPSRPNNFAGPVDRQSSSRPRAPKSGIVKEGGMAKALFPTSQPVLVTYEGLGQDAELARNIEASLTPGAAHNLFVPSQRNLAIENEQGFSQDE